MELDRKRKITIGALALCSVWMVRAGITDTLHAIPEIEIQANRLNYYLIGASVQQIDSSTLINYEANSLAELLNQKSLVAVNSYGYGGLANISIRGGAAHHASVIWNGINIQSPMHGGVNFSTLPVSFIDNAQIQYGGASTLFGSGNASGSIHMTEILNMNRGVIGNISGYFGSANNFVQSARIIISKKRWASSLKLFSQQNKNNFRFLNTEKDIDPTEKIEHPIERLEHGGYRQYGISQSNKVMIGKNSWIGTVFWFLDYHKDIPSLMNNYNPGESSQIDRNIMYSAYYKYAPKLLQFKLLTGGFYNMVDYQDPMPDRSSNNSSYSIINIAEVNLPVHKRFDIGLILEQKYETAQSASYPDKEDRNIVSTILSAKYNSHQIKASFNIREELVDGSLIPVVFSSGIDLYITSDISIKTQFSKNYSLPTMNDLYWENDGFSVGNPDLRPETGWSGEGGIHFVRHRNSSDINVSLVAFNNKINNWIRWIPVSSNFWMPLNVQKGQAQGLEASAEIRHRFKSLGIGLSTRYGYTNAVTLESGETEMQEGEQMWYVPKHNANISFRLTHRFIALDYTQSIVGKRTYDNADGILDPYTTGNIMLKSQLPVKSIMIELLFSINNIWNTVYQVKHAYAMPLRQYMIGLKFNFH